MRDAFASELKNLISKDSQIILITADLGFGVFDEIRNEYPDNFINVGVAEQNMVGIATGLALQGFKIFTYSIANFATLRCLEQIRNDASYHELNINVVSVGGGFSYGALGMSHHASEDISIMRAIPGITVSTPSSNYEAVETTKYLVNSHGVGYLRIDKSSISDDKFIEKEFNFGKCRKLQEGQEVSIFCCGGIIEEAYLAANRLKEHGIGCRIMSTHTVKPIDVNSIQKASKETKGIITLEEHNKIGGLGGAISEICMNHSIRPGFFKSIGIEDTFSTVVGSQKFLRKYYKLDSIFIEKEIKTLLELYG